MTSPANCSTLPAMRILWTGVAAWAPSGYGVATNNIVTRLQKLGHEVKVLTYYGLHGGRVVWNGIEHLPVGEQQFGSDVIGGYIAEFQPDVVITLYDQWVIPSYQQLGSVWLPYVVLHYEPMESALKDAVKGAWRSWALCDWAADVMRAEGIDARAVPLGVDTNVFRPLLGMMDSDGNIFEQQKLKQMVGCPPDQFLVTMVAANRDFRKHLEPQFRVFADFHRKYPDSHLFIKTNASAKEGGWDLPRLWQRLFDLKKKGDVAPISYPAADQATVDPYTLAVFYNASDVYLCCSAAEGYGLPVIEAQACSIPVIGTDYSAMRDIIGSGWKLPYRRFVTPMYSYGAAVDEDALFKALEEAYHMRGTPEYAEMKRKAREHALKYDWDKIVYGTMQRELAEWLEEREL